MVSDESRSPQQSTQSRGLAIIASLLTHAVAAALWIWLSTLPRSFSSEPVRAAPRYDLTWILSPGPGGGGGGGGNQTPIAAPAQQKGRDPVTVPTVSEPKPAASPKEASPVQPLTVPAMPLAAASDILPGVVNPMPAPETTQGSGSRGGAGTGTGAGSGEGRGSGLGLGSGGGTGGGVYRPGSGVSEPQLVHEVKPDYTVRAIRAKVQGLVLLECVVLPDGTIGDVKIVKSLDKEFGLDEQAIKTVKQWRFLPGRRLGEPVPVFVTIELAFVLR